MTWILGPLGVPWEHALPPSFHKMLNILETIQIPTNKPYIFLFLKMHLVTWILGPLGVPWEHAPPPSFHKMLNILESDPLTALVKICFTIKTSFYIDSRGENFPHLTLKASRKTASENVVCLCRLLNILADFSNLFLRTGKQCGPRSYCSGSTLFASSLIWVHTVCKNDF